MNDDTISRQAAIEGINKLMEIHFDRKVVLRKARDVVEQLPHAQTEPCEDAVSREEVLNCLEWQYPDKLPRTKIMELPPVTPKQRTGKWIRNGWAITCSECGYDMPYTVRNFCPNCGAKMEGVSNES